MDRAFGQNSKVKTLLQGLLFSYIITAVVLLIFSFLMLKMDLSSTVISGGINFIYIISALAGGFLVGRKTGQRKFIWGLIMGLCYFVVLLMVSLLLNGDSTLPLGNYLMVFFITGLSGMVGGMLS